MVFREVLPLAVSFVLALGIGWLAIPWLRKLKVGQQIRAEGPSSHQKKAGTPTMGGVIFILSTLIGLSIFHLMNGTSVSLKESLVLGLVVLYGLTGFVDDFRKVRRGRSLGLRAREKMAMLVLFGAVFMILLPAETTSVILPFTRMVVDLGPLYPAFCVFLIVGMGNAVNLTDGLDGLATGVVITGLAAYYVIARNAARIVTGIDGLPALVSCAIGSLLGFLVYNRHPARVFMGDTGSLALGALLASLAIVTRTELVLVLAAVVPVIETLSVIIQVASFQLFGRRVFKMAPVHHHFELLGWHEQKVVALFWVVSLAGAILSLVSMSL